ncbi:hypothetical protein V1523DRAFT_410274 [Lipomyces doorenjongii]
MLHSFAVFHWFVLQATGQSAVLCYEISTWRSLNLLLLIQICSLWGHLQLLAVRETGSELIHTISTRTFQLGPVAPLKSKLRSHFG